MKDYEALHHLREIHGFKKTEVASALNVSYPAYIRYENGERKLPLKLLISASKYYNVPISYFNEELSIPDIGVNGHTIKNTETSEILEVTADEFAMLKGVLEAFRNR